MSTRHFRIEGRLDCALLTDLGSSNGTYVNGQPITESLVGQGDQILAGETLFSVAIGRQAAEQPRPSPPVDAVLAADAVPVCAGLQLTDPGHELLQPPLTVAEFVKVLQQGEHYADALRVISRALGPPAAVRWACRCLDDLQGDRWSKPEQTAIANARAWADEPGAATAQAAQRSATVLENTGPAALIALACVWATPPDSGSGPPIPIDPQIPAQGISAALTLAAVDGPPEKAARKYQTMIRTALADAGH